MWGKLWWSTNRNQITVFCPTVVVSWVCGIAGFLKAWPPPRRFSEPNSWFHTGIYWMARWKQNNIHSGDLSQWTLLRNYIVIIFMPKLLIHSSPEAQSQSHSRLAVWLIRIGVQLWNRTQSLLRSIINGGHLVILFRANCRQHTSLLYMMVIRGE